MDASVTVSLLRPSASVRIDHEQKSHRRHERRVDSSVTAILLKEQGYEVEGVSLILFDPQSRKASGKHLAARWRL